MPGLYFHDAWLLLYNFSKLRKLGVNLVLQMSGCYVGSRRLAPSGPYPRFTSREGSQRLSP